LRFSQEYVAKEIGIAQNTYSLIERGKAKLAVRRLELICKVLDIKPEALFPKNEQLFHEYILKTAMRNKNSNNLNHRNFLRGGNLPLHN
jgi:transcriptional regulator with XRE-family HTH domain